MTLELDFDFHAEISALNNKLARQAGMLDQLARQSIPRFSRVNFTGPGGGTTQYPAAGNLVLFADGPQPGKQWSVKQIIVGGVLVTATPAGVAYVFATTAQPTDLALSTARDFSLTPFPVKGFYGTEAFVIESPANLWVVITGGTPGTYYNAFADVVESDVTPLQSTSYEI
jgi:hypothetical protein